MPVSYYTGYTAGGYNGGVFYRSLNPIDATYPSATLSESYNATALNLGLTQANSDGYDLGFYFLVGTMGTLAANGVAIIGAGFGTNLWINPAAWTWTPIGVGDQFTNLGSAGAYGLGSAVGTQTVDGATTFNDFSGACSGSLTVAAIAAGACPGINASTSVAIWVGITLFSAGASSGSVSTTAVSTTTGTQTVTSTVTSTTTLAGATSTVTSTVTSPAATTTITSTLTSTVTSTLASATTTVTSTVTSPATVTTTVTSTAAAATATTASTTTTAPGGASQLTVNTEDSSGNAITGYYAVLDQDGNAVSTGFSPAAFALESGQTYVVGVQDYGSCHFDHWTDTGSTERQRTLTAANTAQVITAMYDCGTTSGGSSTISVSATNSAGAPMSGYYTTLWQNGGLVQSCFTACSFTVSNGQSYQVMVANFGNEVFNHWSDGTVGRSYTVNMPASGDAIDLTAIYYP